MIISNPSVRFVISTMFIVVAIIVGLYNGSSHDPYLSFFNSELVWTTVLIVFLGMQMTLFSVTAYLHREGAHRSVELTPVIRWLCDFHIWFCTDMDPKMWIAVHRKHHQNPDTEKDPHSPIPPGRWYKVVWAVVWGNVSMYKVQARVFEQDKRAFDEYSANVCLPPFALTSIRKVLPSLGIALLVFFLCSFADPATAFIMSVLFLFNVPFNAGGLVNVVCHLGGKHKLKHLGHSRNVRFLAPLIMGEPLHQNHHIDSASAFFGTREYGGLWDVGGHLIKLLALFRLVEIKRFPNGGKYKEALSQTPKLS